MVDRGIGGLFEGVGAGVGGGEWVRKGGLLLWVEWRARWRGGGAVCLGGFVIGGEWKGQARVVRERGV